MTKYLGRLIAVGMAALLAQQPVIANDANDSVARWDFDVYLDDKKVGKHSFEVAETDGVKQVTSEADFRYKILFFSAYRYEHSNLERWSDNCLVQFDATTNANGKRLATSGRKDGSVFSVTSGEKSVELPECVMSFAYWNRTFLQQPRLLNPQSGEYLDVDVQKLNRDVLDVRGERVAAIPYKLTANELELTVWYSEDDEWLALESVAKGGQIIRYELS
jgi:hypothetical protein